MWNDYSRSRSTTTNIPWLWVWILGGIVVLIVIARFFWGSASVDTDRAHLMISPQTSGSTVFIAMSESSKNRITGTGGQPLYVGDRSISVETGWASATSSDVSIDLDERTEMSYVSHTSTGGDILQLTKWRIWIKQIENSTTTEAKNIRVTTEAGDIAIVEQNNQIYSSVYAIVWDARISTSAGEYTLKAGNRIMVSASDLANPGLQLSSLVWGIDESIATNALFVRNDGKRLLNQLTASTIATGTISTGTTTIGSQYISILEPLDGSLATKATIAVRGSIQSPDIVRVTLNDQETVVSPVNNTFTFAEFPITTEINNIVYKAYIADGTQVEKWVITVLWSKQALDQSVTRLLTNASPISSKDFRIVSPASNPYVMTESAIKVQWTVTKDAVSYILVNGYRLQKYIPGSTTWYYFANIASSTLKNGINLYTIEFYGNKDDLLYTQLFTIIKESKNATLSGESSR